MSEIQQKPTLAEIAAMPFPASLNAMRKHYNADWGSDTPVKARKYEVDVKYRVEETKRDHLVIEALCPADAEEMAYEKLRKRHSEDADIDIYSAKAKEASDFYK